MPQRKRGFLHHAGYYGNGYTKSGDQYQSETDIVQPLPGQCLFRRLIIRFGHLLFQLNAICVELVKIRK